MFHSSSSHEFNNVFRIRYEFQLKDAIDGCPEYLLHFPTLVSYALEYGLQLELEMNFHEFFIYS